jgi:oxygen-dependent protoporphyrinogen oxidase
VVIVGGGVSGLAAAWFLRDAGVRVTVLERAARPGGKLAPAQLAGFTVDAGAEALLARRPEAVDLVRAVGLGEDLVHPQTAAAGLWSRGLVRPLPAGHVLGVPLDQRALRRTGVLSPMGTARAAAERLLPVRPVSGDVSVGMWVRARWGAEVVQRLVDPLLGGVYAGHADQLSLRAAAPALAAAAIAGERLHPAPRDPSPVFAGIRGGVARLVPALVAGSGAAVRTGVTVRGLTRRQHGWELLAGPTSAPESIEADAVILAVPAAAAARLLSRPVPLAADRLGRIEYASAAIVTLLLPRGPRPLHGSGFLVPAVEGRLIKAVTYSSQKWAWTGQVAAGDVVVRASVGRFGETVDLDREDGDLIALVRAELAAATGLAGEPRDALVTRWGGSLPQYTVGHLDRVAAIRTAVAAAPDLAVCGAAYDGIGIAACIASAARAAAAVRAAGHNEAMTAGTVEDE